MHKPKLDVKDKSVNKHLGKVNAKMGYMPGSLYPSIVPCGIF